MSAKSIDFLLNQMRSNVGSLAAGTVTFYEAGTTTLKTIYLNYDMSTQASNPYTLSADGTAELFGSGLYRIIVKNSAGSTVYDYDNVEFEPVIAYYSPPLVELDATAGALAYTIADGTTDFLGYKSDATSNLVTVTPPAGTTIAGSATYVLYVKGESFQIKLPTGETDYIVLR